MAGIVGCGCGDDRDCGPLAKTSLKEAGRWNEPYVSNFTFHNLIAVAHNLQVGAHNL